MAARSKPDDIWTVIACACSAKNFHDAWTSADSVAFVLSKYGMPTTAQQAAARLQRLARLSSPPIATRRRDPWRDYRVTNFGRTWVQNLLPALDLVGDYPHPSELAKEGRT